MSGLPANRICQFLHLHLHHKTPNNNLASPLILKDKPYT